MRVERIPAVHYLSPTHDEIVEHATEGRARRNAAIIGMSFVWVEREVPTFCDAHPTLYRLWMRVRP